MTAVITLSLSSSSPYYHHFNSQSHTPHFLNPKQQHHHHHHPLFIYPKCDRFSHLLYSSQSSSSTTFQQDPFQPGRFVTYEELQKLQLLRNFTYFQELETGSMWAQVMREDEIDMVVELLAQSFAESMFMFLPNAFVSLVGALVKEHLVERRSLMPNTATLIAFFKEKNGEEEELAGTVEINFNQIGANDSPPTPTPPKNDPYICNMTVNKSLRRRGIGWNLLKASEELISQMSSSMEIYLHCRMVDVAPFKMYTRAGYSVVKTDSILILLTLQGRKHLMRKQLPVSNTSFERDILSDCSEKHPS